MTDTQHLLSLAGTPADRMRALLSRADAIASGRAVAPVLSGRTVATLFFEDSTRTRTSFTLAANRLGATVADLSGSGTSASKGETLADTARTVEAMGVDAFIVRTGQSGGPGVIARAVRGAVINAGDGRREHPTQGLLDTLAVARAHGRTDTFDLSGLTVVIAGDTAHSRVTRSDVAALTALGAEVVLCGPPAMAPTGLGRALGCTVERDFDAAIARADAVQMLRIQFERGARVASPRQYRAGYALTPERARTMKPGAIVMHPGPMNRGIEIDQAVADSDGADGLPRSVILEQVRLGVAVRIAVLEAALAGPPPAASGGRARASRVEVGAV